jgi:hypothetical protein
MVGIVGIVFAVGVVPPVFESGLSIDLRLVSGGYFLLWQAWPLVAHNILPSLIL